LKRGSSLPRLRTASHSAEISEFFNHGLRTIPIFSLVLRAFNPDIHGNWRAAVRAAWHSGENPPNARLKSRFRGLFLRNVSIQIDGKKCCRITCGRKSILPSRYSGALKRIGLSSAFFTNPELPRNRRRFRKPRCHAFQSP